MGGTLRREEQGEGDLGGARERVCGGGEWDNEVGKLWPVME